MVPEGGSTQAAPVTRGFLFADLRGYTAFTETHGDKAARELLDAYRRVVREVVGQFGGAEIKTEGDSFYVVFPSATTAVKCGIALVEAASKATRDNPQLPINVGVGIHAGETAEGDEGYVGSAVNVGARLGSAANAGEVLVSETVRGLTRTGGEVRYVSVGNRRFKGLSEPISVFTATSASGGPVVPARPRALGRSRGLLAGALAGATVLAVVIFVLAPRGAAPSPTASPGATGTLGGLASPTVVSVASGSGSPVPTGSGEFAEMPFVDPVAPAGHYRLANFYRSPDLETDGSWRLGSCVYAAPTGICPNKIGYDRDIFELHRADRPQSRLVVMHATELLSDPCANGPVRTIGPDDSFLAWLRAQPALHASLPILRVFPSFRASQLDVTVGASTSPEPTYAETPCPYSDPDAVAMRRYQLGTPLALTVADRVRVFALDSPSNVLAFVIAPNQQEFDLLEPHAEELLNTLHFPEQ